MSNSSDNLFADVLKKAKEETAEETKKEEVVVSEETKTEETKADIKMPSELDMLKQRAKLMGISHSPNIGVEALKAKINEKLIEEEKAAETKVEASTGTQKTKKKSLRQYLHDREMRLVRLRITNLDPKKKDLPGEIFTFANEYLGTVRKFIPYGEATDNGYHVPYCIYKQLRDRQFLDIKVTKDSRGREQVKTRMVREFALEILPDLTPKELAALAAQQAAAAGMD